MNWASGDSAKPQPLTTASPPLPLSRLVRSGRPTSRLAFRPRESYCRRPSRRVTPPMIFCYWTSGQRCTGETCSRVPSAQVRLRSWSPIFRPWTRTRPPRCPYFEQLPWLNVAAKARCRPASLLESSSNTFGYFALSAGSHRIQLPGGKQPKDSVKGSGSSPGFLGICGRSVQRSVTIRQLSVLRGNHDTELSSPT